jgi:hypothetical protein
LSEADWFVRARNGTLVREVGDWQELRDSEAHGGGKLFYFCVGTSLGQFTPPEGVFDTTSHSHPEESVDNKSEEVTDLSATHSTDVVNETNESATTPNKVDADNTTADGSGSQSPADVDKGNDVSLNDVIMQGSRGRVESSYSDRASSAHGRALCLRSYAATTPQQLSFAQGDIITVIHCSDTERWWKGELLGVIGDFLPSHVRLLTSASTEGASASTAAGQGNQTKRAGK